MTTTGKDNKSSPIVTLDSGKVVELDNVLTQFPDTKTAHIHGLDIAKIDLRQIALPSLRALTIEETSLTTIDLEPLSVCDWLTFLRIYKNKKLKRINLSPLGACEYLTDLHLRDNMLDGIDFRQLSNCRRLLYLDLANNPSRELRLKGIGEIENLSELSIGPQDNYGPDEWTIDLSPLFECQNLMKILVPDFYVKFLIGRKYRDAYKRVRWRIPELEEDNKIEFI
ncbi:MAG: hypothetical protein ACXADD_18825 [Candidatus Thorarchaeota archaeon]|jgi:hypothetical protein